MAKRILAVGEVHPAQGEWRLTEIQWVDGEKINYNLVRVHMTPHYSIWDDTDDS